jgi:hypothetical protein
MAGSAAWWGWLFVHGRWERVASGNSLGSGGKRLAREARRRKVPDRLSMMTGGGMPTYVPREEGGSVMGMRIAIVKLKTARRTPTIRPAPKRPLPRPGGDKPATATPPTDRK